MRLALIIALVFFMPVAHGHDGKVMCENMGKIAGVVMKARQKGMPMTALMDNMMSMSAGTPRKMVRLTENMVITAYEKPQYGIAGEADAVQRFRNEWELKCFREF